MLKRSLSVLPAVVALVAAVGAAAPASAATKVVPDAHGDAHARFDITRGTFNNGEKRLSAKVHVADLRYGGEQYYSLTFSPRNNPDIYFTAFSKLHADNSLTNRLTIFNDIGEVSRIPCKVTSIWSPGNDTVKVSLPRSCVKGLTGAQYMSAHLGPNAHRRSQDYVLARYVRAN